MPEKIKELQSPRGLARLAFRAPLWLYSAGLGWFLGERFLELTHKGRKSSLPRRTVLEVVRYDRSNGTYYVASGWGEKSDWFQNVQANPKVTVRSGRQQIHALAKRLTPEEAESELLDYARRHPRALNELSRFMGYRLDGTEEDIRALGRMIPMVAFQSVEPA